MRKSKSPAVGGDSAWWTALLQALVLIGFVAATGTTIGWTSLPSMPSLASLGGPVAIGDWWNRLDDVWENVIQPWAAGVLAEPAGILLLTGLWALAALVGGRAVAASPRPLIRLGACCVAPLAASSGLAILGSSMPEPRALVEAAAIGVASFGVAGFLGKRRQVEEGEVVLGEEPEPAKPAIRPAKWSDIAGYDDVKREVREALEPLVNRELRARLARAGIDPSRGVLLYGPPGTGKTLMARAAATEMGLGCVIVSGPEVLNKYVGESEAAVRRAFDEAKQSAPSILFFDEIEALVPERRGETEGIDGVHRSLVATFLGLMDGAKDMGDVVVMAATNAPDQMDGALLRPGRFDRLVYVPLPDPSTRKAILLRQLKGKPGGAAIDVDQLVKPTERFSGADLAGLIRRAYEAARGGEITTEQLLELVRGTRPSVSLAKLEMYQSLGERMSRSSQPMAHMDAAPKPKLTWADVGGLDDAKQALHEAITLPLEHPDLIAEYGVRPARGVLLYGPPGTGKTLLARVVSDQVNATFISAAGAELSGVSGAEAIRRLFAQAREAAPTVIFVDEIDAIGSRGLSAVGGTAVHQLLVEMDGVRSADSIIVMAATNRPEDLDDALLRPGRFETPILVSLPDTEARRAIFLVHLRGKPGAEAVDVNYLAELSEGTSAAEISAAVNATARRLALQAAKGEAAARGKMTTDDILQHLRLLQTGTRSE